MFSFDELILVKKIIEFAIDSGFKEDLQSEDVSTINVIERKFLAFKVPESNKGTHK